MKDNNQLSRRQVLKHVSLIMGGVASAPLMSYAAGSSTNSAKGVKDALDSIAPFDKLLSVVAEMIIPTTDTPGAISAGVPEFIKLMLSEWYGANERQRFLNQLSIFDAMVIKEGHRSFVSAPDDAKSNVLAQLDQQSNPNVFNEIKELTVFGYYTSEIAVQELNYRPIPGAYKACVPLKEVGRTWLQSGI